MRPAGPGSHAPPPPPRGVRPSRRGPGAGCGAPPRAGPRPPPPRPPRSGPRAGDTRESPAGSGPPPRSYRTAGPHRSGPGPRPRPGRRPSNRRGASRGRRPRRAESVRRSRPPGSPPGARRRPAGPPFCRLRPDIGSSCAGRCVSMQYIETLHSPRLRPKTGRAGPRQEEATMPVPARGFMNRRAFLETGAAVLSAAALPSVRLSARPPFRLSALPPDRLQWWREARFGLFIHWGLYSLLAGEWGGRDDYAEWIRNSAHIPLAEYDRLVARFNPVNFDADAWVGMAKDAGMKYVTITSKHHDGFCLFDSKLTDFCVRSTPFQRDIMREMAEASRRHGLRQCWYHSIMDWHHPDYLPRRDWEAASRPVGDATYARYVEHLHGQVAELLTNYGDIGVMWFDGQWEETWTHEMGRALYARCRELQPADVAVVGEQ